MSTTTEIAKANVKKDRTRSILIIISIALTTLLLTAVSGAGYGIIRLQLVNAAELYGEFYGVYRDVTMESIEEMRRHAAFEEIGLSADYAEVDSDKTLILTCMDEKARAMSHTENAIVEGRYPEAENEIAAAPMFFRRLGVEDPRIGDRVTIALRTDLRSTYKPEEFVICGLLRQGEIETDFMAACTSVKYYEKSVAAADRRYKVLFSLDESLDLTFDNSEEVMRSLAVRCGIDERDVAANNNYLHWRLNPGTETIAVCALTCAGVVFFSVIVVYNIFQVGVIQKIQEYGRLKAVGATRRQMRQIILREGMYLAGVGVPVGMLLGIAAARAALAVIIKEMNAGGITLKMTGVSVLSVPLLILMAALAFVTVWIALRKPMRVVASVSAVEAMRYMDAAGAGGLRRGRHELNVVTLTLANLASHKKHTVSTILTMGLSCVLFVVLANWLGNMDAEYMARAEVWHGQFQLQLQFRLEDEAYPENNLDHILRANPLDEELVQRIWAIPGVTDVRTQRIVYAEQTDAAGERTGDVYGILVLGREDFDRAVRNDEVEGLDYDAMSAQDAVCYGTEFYLEDGGFEIGKTYHFSLYDGVQEKVWNPQMIASFRYLGANMAMTRDTYEKMGFTGDTNCDIWRLCTGRCRRCPGSAGAAGRGGGTHQDRQLSGPACDRKALHARHKTAGVSDLCDRGVYQLYEHGKHDDHKHCHEKAGVWRAAGSRHDKQTAGSKSPVGGDPPQRRHSGGVACCGYSAGICAVPVLQVQFLCRIGHLPLSRQGSAVSASVHGGAADSAVLCPEQEREAGVPCGADSVSRVIGVVIAEETGWKVL